MKDCGPYTFFIVPLTFSYNKEGITSNTLLDEPRVSLRKQKQWKKKPSMWQKVASREHKDNSP